MIDWGTLDTSNFDPATDLDFTGAALAPGVSWDSSNFLVDGTIMVTPEPSTWAMIAVGIVLAQQIRRRRGRAAGDDI